MLLYDILIEGIEIDVLCSLFIAERVGNRTIAF